jgi:hypothetical protein
MENMKTEARNLINMLRSNVPDEQGKAAVLIYEQGMLAQKCIMQTTANPAPADQRTA